MEEVAHLGVRHVKVKVDVVVQRVGDVGPTGAHMEDAAWEACAAAGDVVWGTGRAEGPLADPTGNGALADVALVCGTDAALQLLGEGAMHAMLAAVQQRLGFVQPKSQSPAGDNMIIADMIS